jgi:transposase-like protein
MTYFEFQKQFPTEQDALNFIIEKKYNAQLYCPKCGTIHKKLYRQHYKPQNVYCDNCKNEFSVLTGTIFENTHLDLRMWLYAINLVIISRKGISALQLQRELGMKSYKGAWRMMKQIRLAMGKDEMKEVFEAIVEIDETYVGGKPRKKNKHDEREDNDNFNKRGKGTSKVPVIGVKERGTGKVHAVVANKNKDGKQLSGKQLFSVLNKVCKDNTTVMTDQFSGYNILDKENDKNFIRLQVDHNVMFSMGNEIHTSRTLRALSEDEIFTQSLGKNVYLSKVIAFTAGAMIVAIPGALYAHYISYIDPTSFTVDESIFILSIVIIGGLQNLRGCVVAAAFLVFLPEVLRFIGMPNAIAANMRQIIYGGILIFMMFRYSRGLVMPAKHLSSLK